MKLPFTSEKPDIEKLIKERIDENNSYLDFAKDQYTKDREFFKNLIYVSVLVFGLLATATGINISNSAKDALTETRRMRDDAEAATNKALERVRTDVSERLNKEFASPNLSSQIEAAAKDAIDKKIKKIIDLEIDNALLSVRQKISEYGEQINIANKIALASQGDRNSFEYLLAVSNGAKPESNNHEFKKIATEFVRAIVFEDESVDSSVNIYIGTKNTSELQKLMFSKYSSERYAAIDAYPEGDKSAIPYLIKVLAEDNNTDVMRAATRKLNKLTGQHFVFWDVPQIEAWLSRQNLLPQAAQRK